MEFTYNFIQLFVYGLELATPLLLLLVLLIILLGQIVGKRESWNRFDSLVLGIYYRHHSWLR